MIDGQVLVVAADTAQCLVECRLALLTLVTGLEVFCIVVAVCSSAGLSFISVLILSTSWVIGNSTNEA